MAVETFLVGTIDWLKNINFDQIVYGAPGKVVGYSLAGILWLYVALMIYKDAEHRYLEGSKAKYYWIAAAILAGPLGWLLYLALRPAVDLDESYLQRVEERYLSFESRGLGYCAKCGEGVDPDFLYCSGCGSKIRERCKKCERIVEKIYAYCPTCGAKMRGKPKVALLPASDVEKAEKIRAARMMGKKGKALAGAQKKSEVKPFHVFFSEKLKSGTDKVRGGAKRLFGSLKPKQEASAGEQEKAVEESDSGGKETAQVEKAEKAEEAAPAVQP